MSPYLKVAIAVTSAIWLGLIPCRADPLNSDGYLLTDGELVSAPHAFQNFCRARGDQCVSRGRLDAVKLDGATFGELASVNGHVNRAIRPLAQPASDAYQLGVAVGSCNEYAVEKRRELLAQGWSAAALSLTVVRLPDGRGHLVLTVRTDHGDLVLDNLNPRVVAVDETDYTWVERQSTIHPMLWVRIGGLATASSETSASRASVASHEAAAVGATKAALADQPTSRTVPVRLLEPAT